MAKVRAGLKFTDEEVENLESGMWDDQVIIVRCKVDGWKKIGWVKDLKHDFDVDFFDMEQSFYDVVMED